jgi:hypothetical protein
MAEQTEKAFQKQPLFQNTKARGMFSWRKPKKELR